MDLQAFTIYFVITVLMHGLLLFYGIPFIIAARFFHRWTVLWLNDRTRFALACGIAAVGIAPAYDFHRMPTPIYTWWLQGQSVSGLYLLTSVALTWLIVWFKAGKLARH